MTAPVPINADRLGGSLVANNGNISAVARDLGVCRPTVRRRAWQLGLHKEAGLTPTPARRSLDDGTRAQHSIFMTEARWKWLLHLSVDTGRTVSDLIEEAIDAFQATQPRDPR